MIVSAFIWGGNPAIFMGKAIDGEIDLYLSPEIIQESLRVFRRKGFDEARLAEAKKYMMAAATIITPTVDLKVVVDDPDDDKIVNCAVSSGSEVIVTGDKHLLKLDGYNGIRIMKVAPFLSLGVRR